MTEFVLENGIKIPKIGLGTWKLTDRDTIKSVIKHSYELGYRLIDTAAAYSNEISIAKAIDAAGISRGNLILSNKVWNTSRGYVEVQAACKKSLKKMKADYFDIYLIHWPASMKQYPDWAKLNAQSWRGMEQLYQDGLAKSIGVCNFKKHHLEELSKTWKIMPFINQIEFHPGFYQADTVEYCKEKGIYIEASSPLGNGQILSNGQLTDLAKKYGKSSAQICIRWALQKGVTVIPKSEKKERLKENIEVFDFHLSVDEMNIIDAIPYCGGIGFDSDGATDFG